MSPADKTLSTLVEEALRQQTLPDVSKILQHIASSLDSFGCILWEETPKSALPSAPGRFFVLVQWFQQGRMCAVHDLPQESVTGQAVLERTSIHVRDTFRDKRVHFDAFLSENGIGTFCCAPLSFVDGKRGSLNVYRKGVKPFSRAALAQLAEIARLLPHLYQAILNRFSFDLLAKLNDLLRGAQNRIQESDLSVDEARNCVGDFCQIISSAFRSVEATALLADVTGSPDVFRVIATTWPGKLKRVWYHASRRQGLTGWVLEKAEPIRLFDLNRFQRDKEEIRARYPGIRWANRDRLVETAKAYFLSAAAEQDQPPLSFMAVPVVVGGRLIGALRCSLQVRDPFFFADRELELLRLAADQIGHFWSDFSARHKMKQENRSWKSLVESLGKLNYFVYRELNQDLPKEQRIFAEALRVTKSAIVGSDIMDVRLQDPKRQELFFFQPTGSAWDEGSPDDIARRKAKRFSVGGRGRPTSAGAVVFKTGKVRVITDPANDPYYDPTFPKTRRMIIAPIRVEGTSYGVLDIRGTGDAPFPPHAHIMAELLGNQLGLYHFLADIIGKLKSTDAELRAKVEQLRVTQRQERQTFGDLAHQFKNPMQLAHARAKEVLTQDLDPLLRSTLEAIRSLCGKAMRATLRVDIFSALAHERPLELSYSPLDSFWLAKLLSDAMADQQVLVDPDRRIRFLLDRDSLGILRTLAVYVDEDLLEQAMTNLLDNAGKYSYPGTTVRVFGGRTGTGRFHITVANEGLAIKATDIGQGIVRGWRGDDAKLATGEGSGIGLWIVHNIMQAHGGSLVIAPTNAKSETEVRLVFPVVQPNRR